MSAKPRRRFTLANAEVKTGLVWASLILAASLSCSGSIAENDESSVPHGLDKERAGAQMTNGTPGLNNPEGTGTTGLPDRSASPQTAAGMAVPPGTMAPVPGAPRVASLTGTRLWRLTPAQYKNAVEKALGSDVDLASLAITTHQESFLNEASTLRVDELFFSALEESARRIVVAQFGQITAQLGCAVATATPPCIEAFVRAFGAKLRRAPVINPQAFLTLFTSVAAKGGNREALEDVAVALLLDPKTLFRTELGEQPGPARGPVPLTAFEVAESLAFTLTNSAPDGELSARAADGTLSRPDVLATQARRLLDSPAGTLGVTEFLVQWLGLGTFGSVEKNAARFPQFTPTLRASMLAETTRFLSHILTTQSGGFPALLTLPESFPDEALGKTIYRLDNVRGQPKTPVAMNPEQRSGVFTQAAVISAISDQAQTGLMHRGKFLLHKLQCLDLAIPDGNVQANFDDLPPNATFRQKFQSIESRSPCGSCHKILNPVAFSLENYDAIGRYRSVDENNNAIDASGVLTLTTPTPFKNAIDMFRTLSTSSEVHQCFAMQAFRYVYGRPVRSGDEPEWTSAYERFRQGSLSMRVVLQALTSSQIFTRRERI